MINSDFDSVDEAEFASLEAARQLAVTTAVKVACESLASGGAAAAVELEISEGESVVARHVVTLSLADLAVGEETVDEAP
jgi:hypothetical protein